jgi:hypothetical protein
MKLVPLVIIASTLAACASKAPPRPSAAPETNKSLAAFEEVCLKTAPSFSGAKAAAANHGIAEVQDLGFTQMGMAKDNSIGVQIKPDTECAITTPSQKASDLGKGFYQVIVRNAETPPASRFPTKAKVGGVTFIFQHDRQGGEAFVMLKAKD